MDISPRLVGLVLPLLALAPAAAFVVLKSELIAVVTFVNILLIAGSLAVALSPHEHDTNGHSGPEGV